MHLLLKLCYIFLYLSVNNIIFHLFSESFACASIQQTDLVDESKTLKEREQELRQLATTIRARHFPLTPYNAMVNLWPLLRSG